MIGKLKFQEYKDWSKGTWQNAQNSIAPKNSCKLGLNLNSDEEIGSLVSRKGTTIVGSQIISGKDVLGLHNYRDSLGSGDKLFAAVSDGNNVDIYDVETGIKSLENDTHPISLSISPSFSKSVSPSTSLSPSKSPSVSPSIVSTSPSVSPSLSSSISASTSPSISPSLSVSISPSVSPSAGSRSPSASPSISPSVSASSSPSLSSSTSPSLSPSHSPGDVQELIYTSLFDDPNLKAYYRFESGALQTDSSGEGHSLGTAISDPAEVSGKFGGGLGLDGNDAYPIVNHADFKPTGNFTVGVWLKATGTSITFFQSFSQDPNFAGFRFNLDASGKVSFVSGRNTGIVSGTDFGLVTGTTVLTDGYWSLCVATWDGSYLRLYVNGSLEGETAWDNAPSYAATNYIRVGCRNNTGTDANFITGSLDELFLLNGTALSTTQINDFYNGRLGASSFSPSKSLSASPSVSPSTSISPSASPSKSISVSPSISSSISPPNSFSSSASPSVSPSVSPPQSESPSISPSVSSSLSPSVSTSISPSISPSISSSLSPSRSSSISPSASPSVSPSVTTYEGIKTRFLTYLNSCLRLNGINSPKAYNGTSWITTGGVFDLSDMPQASKYAIEFKDRVYVAGKSDAPDQVDISSIADSQTRTVSWDTADGAKFIVFEQEDGGGGITGLWKVPGYVIVGKKRTIKRYDGSSAYPEDMVNQGIPTQECGVTAQGMLFWVNENGAWATEGGKPKKISTYTVDKIIKSCTDFMWVASGTDEEHVFFSFPSVTISGETYTNVVLKYNIFQNTWDARKYPTHHTCYAKYVDDSETVFLALGDNDGTVRKIDTGNSDDGVGITYALETQDIDFGMRGKTKKISDIDVLTENVSKGSLMYRTTHEASDWKPLGKIDKEAVNITKSISGRYFNFKLSETVNSGQAKIIGLEFPEGIEVHS
jgi:hypothetical protein